MDWPRGSEPEYTSCTRSELDTLKKLKGSKVTFRATVTGGRVEDRIFVKDTKKLAIQLSVGPASADGFLPESAKPKDSK